MVNYQNGKIYKITGTTNEGVELIYIGSTVQKLCVRLSGHVRDFKNGEHKSSSQVLVCYNYKITLIEIFPCSSKEELLMRERYHYDYFDCVNKKKPILLEEERIEYNKQYHIENKDRIRENQKQYYNNNIDTIRENKKQYAIDNANSISEYNKQYNIKNADKRKEYAIDNKDTISEYQKQYRIKNADRIREKNRQYYLKKKENKTL